MKITNYIPVILCSIALCGRLTPPKPSDSAPTATPSKPRHGRNPHRQVSAEEWVATTDEPWITVSPTAAARPNAACTIDFGS